MNLDSFTGPGSTASRRRFWDKVTQAVIACQKVEGNNVTVAEHQGAGTLINVNRVRGLEGGIGACCYDDGTPCSDLSESDCADSGGTWHEGTPCADESSPCGCVTCGDRLTAVFSDTSEDNLNNYSWPLGLTCLTDLGGGATLFNWDGANDAGPFNVGGINVVVQCNSGGGWTIEAGAAFSAFGIGSLPLGIPITNAGGTVTITCGGAWGACCVNDFAVCYGCNAGIPCNMPGGMGQEQCEVLLASDIGFATTFQGDHVTCADDPCGAGSC